MKYSVIAEQNGNSEAVSDVRLNARAVACLRELIAGAIVGYVYEWNTGERKKIWLKETVRSAQVCLISGLNRAGFAGGSNS
ncbi:hypothetical protein EG244_20250 [Falsigemmobacter faecalis]|uniref:Uncharacterized protein n=1 Tax=Falsigemmobacter faecalis TaxID=2488730 RepID=A0A3P3D443_9RHOB|nr:hypothetical protein EG244_20250 [Falsigemmobacter faecalis]